MSDKINDRIEVLENKVVELEELICKMGEITTAHIEDALTMLHRLNDLENKCK